MAAKKKIERLNITLPQEIKRGFDAVCALEGLNMSDIAAGLIADWLAENAPPGMLESLSQSSSEDSKETNEDTIASLVTRNLDALGNSGIKNLSAIAKGAKPSTADRARLARALNMSEEDIERIYQQSFPSKEKQPNGHH